MKANAREERYQKLTHEPVGKLLFQMSVPTIIVMLVSNIYSMADTFFVSRLGNDNLTASVGIVFSFMAVVQAVGFLFGHGSGNYISRCLGRKDYKKAETMAATGLILSVFFGVVLMLISLVFLQPLAGLLGAGVSKELMNSSVEYLRIIIYAVPFMLGSLTLNNQLRLQGSARDGMIGMAAGMLLNTILDPILIFNFHLSVTGAGLATLCGQVISFFLLLFMSFRNGNVAPRIRNFKMNKSYLRQIFGGGMPNLLRQGIAGVAGILLNWAAGVYTESAIAAFTVTNRICMVGFAIVIGMGQGFQPICGYNYGALEYKRVKQAFYCCLRAMTIFLIIVFIGLQVGAPALMGCFSKDASVIDIGVRTLRYQCVSIVFLGYYTLVGMLLQNIGRFKQAAMVSAARQLLFFVPFILILPKLFGLTGVMLAQPSADICAFCFAIPFGQSCIRKLSTKL